MKAKDLKNLILSLTCDIQFGYRGYDGAICPFAKDNLFLGYGDSDKYYKNIDDLMNDKIFYGKSLNDISNEIVIY